jgi:hypothetical protein
VTYTNSTSFRRALEDRLRNPSLQTGVPLARLRKMVVFDRLLMRLVHDRPDAWVLKGGLALQLRLGNQARTTKDMDVLLAVPPDRADDIHQALVRAALLDVGDWFQFEKDLIDILLIAELGKMDGQLLRQALEAAFEARTTHELPRSLPDPPRSWTAPFRRLAGETGLDYPTLPDAVDAARRFIDPVLHSKATGTWDPVTWSWHPPGTPPAG